MEYQPNKEYAGRIYDILVEECGAPVGEHFSFVHSQTAPRICTEYRFCGIFGFGGKFWVNGGKWYVNCYREHETPERLETMRKTNLRLAELLSEFKESL